MAATAAALARAAPAGGGDGMMLLAQPFLLSLALSLALVAACRGVARRFGLVAKPREDRWHTRPVALFGGVGIAVSLFTTALVLGNVMAVKVLVIAGAGVFIMGLADDVWSLKPVTKLVIEIALASVFLSFGYRLNWVGGITIDSMLTLVWIVGLTNAFNLLDNMDGLCGGIAVIAGTAFLLAVLPVAPGSPPFHHAAYLAALLGSILGFLVYNLHPASIFMGDSGSLLIGMTLAGLTLTIGTHVISREKLLSVVAVPVLVLLIPIFDTTLVTISRMLSGRPTSVGGRDHSSHRLVAIGLSERSAVTVLWGLAVVAGALAVVVRRLDVWWGIVAVAAFIIAMTIFAVYLGGIRVYDERDEQSLKAKGLTPIVVDFVYKRRIAEVLLDFTLIGLCYYAAYRLKYDPVLWNANFPYFLQSLPIVMAAQLVSFFAVGVYRGVWRYFSAPDALTIVKGTLLGTAITQFALLYLYLFLGYSRAVFVIDALLLMLAVTTSRASFRMIGETVQRRRRGGRRVVVYGAGDGGALAVRELLKSSQNSVRIVGFVDDDSRKRRMRVQGYPVLGGFESLTTLILAGAVDAVVVSIRVIDVARLRALEDLCTEHDVPLSRLFVGLEALVGQRDPTLGVDHRAENTGS
jgi:UDP-GlcNAc:undecaprenyl-phosphate/decaprenyl-phosphate GlcNAc-1-phosphate transferase